MLFCGLLRELKKNWSNWIYIKFTSRVSSYIIQALDVTLLGWSN